MTIPQVDRSLEHQRSIDRSNRAIVAIVAVTCAAILIASVVFFAIVDHKVSVIREDQVRNTHISTTRSDCQNAAFNAILKDVRLAFQNDKNARDYAKAVTGC